MNVQRTIRRQIVKKRARHGKENTQTALNNLLWKIVMQRGGKISMPVDELKKVPANAALMGQVDSKTNKFVVVAAMRPNKSGLYLPPGAEDES